LRDGNCAALRQLSTSRGYRAIVETVAPLLDNGGEPTPDDLRASAGIFEHLARLNSVADARATAVILSRREQLIDFIKTPDGWKLDNVRWAENE